MESYLVIDLPAIFRNIAREELEDELAYVERHEESVGVLLALLPGVVSVQAGTTLLRRFIPASFD